MDRHERQRRLQERDDLEIIGHLNVQDCMRLIQRSLPRTNDAMRFVAAVEELLG